ncbi:MAG: (2Fe-2S)-binding protein [Clostridia bacterium]|nr:(2Fe-2S)-binding protein [Clostridia bacterium]
MKQEISLRINGEQYQITTAPERLLVDVLREDLLLTGTKKGCAEGECGACTVLIDGEPVASCMTLVGQVQGKEITTIEGLARNGELHPIQKAFVELGAIQCGFCSPGFIMVAKALLDKNPNPTEEEIKRAIAGNLCRCTGYQKIVEAIQAAAKEMAGGGDGE